MKTKIKFAILISRLVELLIFIGGLLILIYGGIYYLPWTVIFIVLAIITMIWGTLGVLDFFEETILGNIFLLVILVVNFSIFVVCLVNSLLFFNPMVLFLSIMIMISAGISFYYNVIVNSVA
ncbi:MAG: hypothetical protein GF329_12280 [Candidatus Lokiarchaeota archaeon]|nr:hypothetical protein [Candidatus Lokiarchaeota archaeon]